MIRESKKKLKEVPERESIHCRTRKMNNETHIINRKREEIEREEATAKCMKYILLNKGSMICKECKRTVWKEDNGGCEWK